MKAVVLDGYTLNPGDLSWDELKDLCDLTVYERTSENEVIDRIKDADIVLTNKTPITKDTIKACKKLKYIGVLATGYNIVDVEAAKKRNIPVTNVPKYSTMSVAQLVFAHLLAICHHVNSHSDAVKNGQWSSNPDFCFWNYPLIELDQKIMGIIGFGAIGQAVATIAKAFGMKVLVYNRTVKKELEDDQLKFVSLDECLKYSDVISLHVPLTPSTKELINKESIDLMKDGVILINTSRGPLIDEAALYEALKTKKIYWAGIDVVSKEPIHINNDLLKLDNIFITPHIAWAPKEARIRLMNIAVQNVRSFFLNQTMNVVNDVL